MRDEIKLFAMRMEQKMAKNDHKTDWHELPIPALFKKLLIEIEEFKVAHEYETTEDARNELVDVANFCMMLWTRIQSNKEGEQHV